MSTTNSTQSSLKSQSRDGLLPVDLNDWPSVKKHCPALGLLELSALYSDHNGPGHFYRCQLIIDRLKQLVGPAARDAALREESVADITEKAIWTAFHQEVPTA